MEERKAQLSLYHLNSIVHEINDLVTDLSQLNYILPQSLFKSIIKHTIIRTCAFYDELKSHTIKLLKTDDQRYQALVIVEQYIVSKRESYFQDLYKFRNNILAHNYRNKSESYRSVFEKETFYTVPNSISELIINYILIDTMLSTVKYLYPEIYKIIEEDIFEPKAIGTLINDDNYNNIRNRIQKDVQRIVDENLKNLSNN